MTLLAHHDITHLSGFHTPARARFFYVYDGDDIGELRHVFSFAHEQNLPILVIGGGQNSLFAFDEFPGLVIHNASDGYTRI
jgi:UDP-N-acetylenolpyruvoylglucosamine reductase